MNLFCLDNNYIILIYKLMMIDVYVLQGEPIHASVHKCFLASVEIYVNCI